MSEHKDATGYLLALRSDIPFDWFSFACDLALAATDGNVASDDLKTLKGLFLGKEKYEPKTSRFAATTTTTTTTASPIVNKPLRELSHFRNFKRLLDTLNITFDKRITLVFGTNGSGKSSLCEAVRILASPNAPDGPLNNVYGSLLSKPSFDYRFEPDTSLSDWDESHGYGMFSSRIKYFDSTIAISGVNDELHPETVVEISPFRLEVFDYCRNIVGCLKDALNSFVTDLNTQIDTERSAIDTAFSDIADEYKTAITALSSERWDALEQELEAFTPSTAEDLRANEEAKVALARLTEAGTEQGIKLLQSEATVLRRLEVSLHRLCELCEKTSLNEYTKSVMRIVGCTAANSTLAEDIVPEGIGVGHFKAFLESSTSVFTFPGTQSDLCPFCRRPFDKASFELIGRYHAFLVNTLQDEIATLTENINTAAINLETIRGFTLDIDEDTSSILSAEERKELLTFVDGLKAAVPDPLPRYEEPVLGDFGNIVLLEKWVRHCGREADKRDVAIETAKSSTAERPKEILRLTRVTQQQSYHEKFAKNYEDIKKLVTKSKYCRAIQEMIQETDFPTILRRMTNAGKKAHSELVVAEFEKSLDKEYVALSGKSLTDFGIRLKPRGEQQAVAVQTHIGDSPIKRILSEGEQKVHALALFFCEAMARPCDILVFDDPSTSFDYNHVGRFVERLRDLVRHYPDSQIILFTHNWDLFVQVQRTFNKARFDSFTEVKVLENCSHVEAYTEKLDNLKSEVADILAQPGGLDRSTEERLAGLMRRLIEAVVNTHVFNGQRHQFKQKTQSVSTFHDYMHLVPLLHHQAEKLSDLYAHLSVTEHDDPRNIYTKRSKAGFQQWCDEILTIETDLLSRRP